MTNVVSGSAVRIAQTVRLLRRVLEPPKTEEESQRHWSGAALAAASAAFLLGAAVVIVADFNRARLEHAHSFGCETIDLSQRGSIGEQLEKIPRVPEVDCAVDCVGFEAKGHGGKDEPAVVLNQLMEATRAAGAIGIPGLYVTEDPGAKDSAARSGNLTMRFGLGWAKSHSFTTGQTPVMKYHRGLMMAILQDRIKIAKAFNVELISLGQAPEGYQSFDSGVPKKFVIDPHHWLPSSGGVPPAGCASWSSIAAASGCPSPPTTLFE